MSSVGSKHSFVHNFFFHPLLNTRQKTKTVLAIITNIFLTAATGGLWQIPFWIVNRLDHKRVQKLSSESNQKLSGAASTVFPGQATSTSKPDTPPPSSTTETPGTGTGTVNETGAKEKVTPATMPPLSEIAFGVEQWENHFGKVEGTIPPLPDNIEDILKADCPFFAGKKVWQTHKLVLIPEKVNGQPLNELMGDPLIKVSKSLQMSAPAAHWLLITTDPVEGDATLEKTYWEQRKIIEEISTRQNLSYKVPDALDVSIATLISHKIGKPLFTDFTTRCEGRDRYGKALVRVFSPSDGKIEVLNLTDNVMPGSGMVAARLFFASGPEEISKTTPDVSQIALGEKEWETYFGEVGNAPPLPTNIQEIIGRDCPLVPGKKIWQTHSLVLIPEKVSGVTLTLESMGELVKKPKAGYPSKFMDNPRDLSPEEFAEIQLPDLLKKQSAPSHWVLISNDVLRGENGGCETRELTYSNQTVALQKLAEKSPIPYTIPSVRDLAISVFMRHVSKGDYPFGRDSDYVFSRCQEMSNGQPVALGGWYDSVNGLFVGRIHSNDAHDIGMAASWVIENDSLDETAPF